MSTPWWDPDAHADRRPFLLARVRILQAVRAWLAREAFLEVDPAALQLSPGNEAHLHGVAVALRATDGSEAGRLWLHTSPEFAMKKLLAAGERRIASLVHVFRDRERGPLHHPEFTMLEWYRAGEPWTVAMADCTALLATAAQAAGADRLTWRGTTCDPLAPPERLTLAQAFTREAGIDLLATVALDGTTDRAALAAGAAEAGIRIATDDTWSDIFSRVLVERIEPRLGHGRPTLLCEYPTAEAALARRTAHDPRTAERFELYACGVELANGFGELTDPAEQRRRFTAEMDEKERVHGERCPLDEDFLQALAHMPEATGVALGLDRLVMLTTGARHIEHVLWTPVAGRG